MENVTEHIVPDDALQHFLKTVGEKVSTADGWIGCVVVKKGNTLELAIRTTYQFPRGDYTAVVALLASELHADNVEYEKSKTPPPLPSIDRESLLARISGNTGGTENDPVIQKSTQDVLDLNVVNRELDEASLESQVEDDE